MTIPSCNMRCETVNDCDLGIPNYDTDNFECVDDFCMPLGCNSDEECEEAYPGFDFGCHDFFGIPMCTQRCDLPADCGLGMSYFEEDNYDCVDGFCLHTGCNSTEECIGAFDDNWECIAL